MDSSRTLLILRRPPYDSGRNKSAVDMALALTVFDIPVDMLFLGDGVWQLLPDQEVKVTPAKSMQKTLASFPLYDVDQLYAEAEALEQRNLNAASLPHSVQAIPRQDLGEFCSSFRQVLVF
ncbi:MAG: DsrE family protein [Pseudomonadota bacterium]